MIEYVNVTSVGKTYIVIRVQLSGAGDVYCISKMSYGVVTNATMTEIYALGLRNSTFLGVATFTFLNLLQGQPYAFFCATRSIHGNKMTLHDMLNTKVVTTTRCCIDVTVHLSSVSISTSSILRTIGSVSIDGMLPGASNLSMLVDIAPIPGKSQCSNGWQYPNEHALSALPSDAGGGTLTNIDIWFATLCPGEYRVSVTLRGRQSSRYQLVYPNSDNFTVYMPSSPPPAPLLLSAGFVSYGELIEIVFDSTTDLGGMPNAYFSCNLLVVFEGSTAAKCYWKDASHLFAILGPSATVRGGDTLLILADAISSACDPAQRDCSSRTYSPMTSLRLSILTTQTPQVVISAPASIGVCSDFILDASKSHGSGGRAWKSVKVSIQSNDPNISVLQNYYSSSFSLDPPLPLPTSMKALRAGFRYVFDVTLCSFLGYCGSNVHTLDVANSTTTSVYIKPTPTTVFHSESLQVEAVVVTDKCRLVDVFVGWEVERDGHTVPILAAPSAHSQSYIIPAKTLLAGQYYKIVAIAYSSTHPSMRVASHSRLVWVGRSRLVAVISAGPSNRVRPGEALVLDATSSYDPDNMLENLKYSWRCIILGNLSDPASQLQCSHLLTPAPDSSLHSAVVFKPLSSANSDDLYLVTLTISSADGHFASTSTKINIVPATAPTLTVTPVTGKYNPNSKLKLEASVHSTYSGTATWMLGTNAVTGSGITLFSASTFAIRADYFTPTNLVVRSGSLTAGLTYTFTLLFQSPSLSRPSMVSVNVVVNSAPISGTFSVNPSTGIEISDVFTLTTSYWNDPDLPMTYEFGYYDFSGSLLVVRPRKADAFTSQTLGRGNQQKGFSLVCGVRVYDSLNAFATKTTSVKVTSMIGSETEHTYAVETLIAQSADDPTVLQQGIAVHSSATTVANCSRAPNCSVLNRISCYSVAHTCGPCLPGDFVGEYGNRNSPCVLRSLLPMVPKQPGDLCDTVTTWSCGPFLKCIAGTCVAPSKICPDSCSNRGECVFVLKDSGQVVTHCQNGNPSCEATCRCQSGFYGKSCESSSTVVSAKSTRVTLLLCALRNLVRMLPATTESVESQLVLVTTLAREATLLTQDAAVCAVSAMSTLMESARQLRIPFDSVSIVWDAVNGLLSFEEYYDIDTLTSHFRIEVVHNVTKALEFYCGIAIMDATVGSYAFHSYGSRITFSAIISVTSAQLSLPLSAEESYAGLSSSYVDNRVNAGGLCLLSIDSIVYGVQEAAQQSNAIVVILPIAPNVDEYTNETIGMSISYLSEYSNQGNLATGSRWTGITTDGSYRNLQSTTTNTRGYCTKADVGSFVNVTCANGLTTELPCQGSAGYWDVTCPGVSVVNKCLMREGAVLVDVGCVLNTSLSSGESAYCQCPMLIFRVTADLAKAEFVVTTETTAGGTFESIWISNYQDEDTNESRVVVISLCTLAVVAALVCLCGSHMDANDPSVNTGKVRAVGTIPLVQCLHNIDILFPSMSMGSTWYSTLCRDINQSHRWVSLRSYCSSWQSRFARAIRCFYSAAVAFFVITLLYFMLEREQEHRDCSKQLSRQRCVGQRDGISSFDKLCTWDWRQKQCTDSDISSNVFIIISVALVAAVVSIPLAYAIDCMLWYALDTSPMKKGATSVLPVSVPPREEVSLSLSLSTAAKPRVQVASDVIGEAQSDLIDLLNELRVYWALQTPHRQNALDAHWQLSIGEIDAVAGVERTNPVDRIRMMATFSMTKTDSLRRLLDGIVRCRHAARNEIAVMNLLPPRVRGLRLLYLMLLDLLGHDRGRVVAKAARHQWHLTDREVTPALISSLRFAAVLMLAILVYPMVQFGISTDKELQLAWLYSVVTWLIGDIFIVSTLVVATSQLAIPSLCASDIKTARRTLRQAVRETYDQMQSHADDIELNLRNPSGSASQMFNSSKFLFTSVRVASVFPDISESRVALKLTSITPHCCSEESPPSVLIRVLSKVPKQLEYFIWSFAYWLLLGVLLVVHLVLFDVKRVLVVTPTVFTVTILCPLVYYSYYGHARKHTEKPTRVVPWQYDGAVPSPIVNATIPATESRCAIDVRSPELLSANNPAYEERKHSENSGDNTTVSQAVDVRSMEKEPGGAASVSADREVDDSGHSASSFVPLHHRESGSAYSADPEILLPRSGAGSVPLEAAASSASDAGVDQIDDISKAPHRLNDKDKFAGVVVTAELAGDAMADERSTEQEQRMASLADMLWMSEPCDHVPTKVAGRNEGLNDTSTPLVGVPLVQEQPEQVVQLVPEPIAPESAVSEPLVQESPHMVENKVPLPIVATDMQAAMSTPCKDVRDEEGRRFLTFTVDSDEGDDDIHIRIVTARRASKPHRSTTQGVVTPRRIFMSTVTGDYDADDDCASIRVIPRRTSKDGDNPQNCIGRTKPFTSSRNVSAKKSGARSGMFMSRGNKPTARNKRIVREPARQPKKSKKSPTLNVRNLFEISNSGSSDDDNGRTTSSPHRWARPIPQSQTEVKGTKNAVDFATPHMPSPSALLGKHASMSDGMAMHSHATEVVGDRKRYLEHKITELNDERKKKFERNSDLRMKLELQLLEKMHLK